MISATLLLSLSIGLATPGHPDADQEQAENPIYQACLAHGGEAMTCGCLEREARSRFNLDQRRVIAAAMPELSRIGEPQDLVDSLGMSLDQILNLRQRVTYAEPVLREACGQGLGRSGR
jgi:hypothetical protein